MPKKLKHIIEIDQKYQMEIVLALMSRARLMKENSETFSDAESRAYWLAKHRACLEAAKEVREALGKVKVR